MSEEENVITATETPEEVLEGIKQGGDVREKLIERLGNLKRILSSIEEREANQGVYVSGQETAEPEQNELSVDQLESSEYDRSSDDLRLFHLERNIVILGNISRDLQSIINTTRFVTSTNTYTIAGTESEVGNKAHQALEKIVKIYDDCIRRLRVSVRQ